MLESWTPLNIDTTHADCLLNHLCPDGRRRVLLLVAFIPAQLFRGGGSPTYH